MKFTYPVMLFVALLAGCNRTPPWTIQLWTAADIQKEFEVSHAEFLHAAKGDSRTDWVVQPTAYRLTDNTADEQWDYYDSNGTTTHYCVYLWDKEGHDAIRAAILSQDGRLFHLEQIEADKKPAEKKKRK